MEKLVACKKVYAPNERIFGVVGAILNWLFRLTSSEYKCQSKPQNCPHKGGGDIYLDADGKAPIRK